MNGLRTVAILLALALFSFGCGSGGGGESDGGCDGNCAEQSLTAGDVRLIVAQAVSEAEALGVQATISVVDRVGNVLAVFSMSDSAANTVISSRRGVEGGLENLVVPSELAAISKAGTGAYLTSQGNAFTTRTASQIVQENFNPGERGRPGGPLFGVQFSQLVCGDLVTAFSEQDPEDQRGPRRLPLGLAADPGGLPLFKDSSGPDMVGRVPVGGVGVELGCKILDSCAACSAQGSGACSPVPGSPDASCESAVERGYGLDRNIANSDINWEERIASAATRGFEAPADRRANRIAVDGKFLRFVDDDDSSGAAADPCESLDGAFLAIPGFTDVDSCAAIHGGARTGHPDSGIAATTFEGLPATIIVDANGDNRFSPTASANITEVEARTILKNALAVALRTRAQIRRPLGVHAQVSIVLVDDQGNNLGIVRTRDAPVFGIDVALQKARTAAFFSSAHAKADLENAGPPVSDYVAKAQTFLVQNARFNGEPISVDEVLTGGIAFGDRAGGNLSRPFFPDGLNGNANGPFSFPFDQWSPFKTGLQLDLVFGGIADVLCAGNARSSCTDIGSLPNGIQIFPGSVPVYRGSTLVGGLGISGDGIDQDDLISFLGLHNAGIELGTGIGNAPPEIRSDNLSVNGAHLRFVNCPVKPFIDSDVQGVCDGK